MNFFRLFKIGVYILDRNLNVREYFEPEKRNTNIRPYICYFIYHNQHIYHLNHNLKSLEQKLQSKLNDKDVICRMPNSRYYLKKQDEEISDLIFVDNSNDVLAVLNNEAIGNINCFDLYFDLIKIGIEPTVSIKNGKVSFDMLKMNNINKKILRFSLTRKKVLRYTKNSETTKSINTISKKEIGR